MRSLLLVCLVLLAGCISTAIQNPDRTAMIGSDDEGRGITVRIMNVDGVTVPWDYIQGYDAPFDVTPGAHRVSLKVRTVNFVCYPVFDLQVTERQVYRFAAKADGDLFHVSVDVREQGVWKTGVIAAQVRAGPITIADTSP